jgi:hypothetical protein
MVLKPVSRMGPPPVRLAPVTPKYINKTSMLWKWPRGGGGWPKNGLIWRPRRGRRRPFWPWSSEEARGQVLRGCGRSWPGRGRPSSPQHRAPPPPRHELSPFIRSPRCRGNADKSVSSARSLAHLRVVTALRFLASGNNSGNNLQISDAVTRLGQRRRPGARKSPAQGGASHDQRKAHFIALGRTLRQPAGHGLLRVITRHGRRVVARRPKRAVAIDSGGHRAVASAGLPGSSHDH